MQNVKEYVNVKVAQQYKNIYFVYNHQFVLTKNIFVTALKV